MTAIKGVSLESGYLLSVMVVLLVCAVLLGALLLGRAGGARRSRFGRVSRWGAGALAVVLPSLMVLAVGGLIVNRAGHYLTTVGDIFGSLSSQSTGTGNVLPLATSEELDEPPADAWKATGGPRFKTVSPVAGVGRGGRRLVRRRPRRDPRPPIAPIAGRATCAPTRASPGTHTPLHAPRRNRHFRTR